MDFWRWRVPLKRLLSGTPFYHAAKPVWDRLRAREDKAAFHAAHPDISYVRYSKSRTAELRRTGYHSQFGQDHYLWNKVLGDATGPGFFIDVGANSPTHNSNSLYLEQRGWSGYAFDANAAFAPMWEAQRRAKFFNVAISDRHETRRFVEFLPDAGWEHLVSGFEDCVRPDDTAVLKSRTYDVECAPLTDFVAADQEIDIAFIDVEGAEMLVLAGMDLDKTRPRLIMIENERVPGGRKVIRDYMTAQGYHLVARIGGADDLFERDKPH